MSKRRFKKIIEIAIVNFKDPYYQQFAAQLAFYLFLSIVPIIALILYLLGIFNISNDLLGKIFGQYLDSTTNAFLQDFLTQGGAVGLNIAMIVVALWSASKAQFSLTRITNYTMTGGQTTGSYFIERARSLITMFIFIASLTASLIVMVYGREIVEGFLAMKYYKIDAAEFWDVVRWPIVIIMYFSVIALNYYLVPSKRLPFRKIIPGAVFASIGFLAVTIAYSIYQKYVSNQSLLYGSFASIVALLIWFYIIAWVMWIGTLLNKCLIDSKPYK